MVLSCWSAKGGSGTTVVAVALSVLLAGEVEAGSLLVDLEGDAPVVFGISQPEGPGITDWLAASPSVGTAALERLEHSAADGVRMIPSGRRALSSEERAALCVQHFKNDQRPVVVDVGCVTGDTDADDLVRRSFLEASTTSLLVTRACFLSLRRAMTLPIRPTGIVLIEESGRALGGSDIEDILGVPVVASIDIDPAVARSVDSGLFATRLPATMGRALRDVA